MEIGKRIYFLNPRETRNIVVRDLNKFYNFDPYVNFRYLTNAAISGPDKFFHNYSHMATRIYNSFIRVCSGQLYLFQYKSITHFIPYLDLVLFSQGQSSNQKSTLNISAFSLIGLVQITLNGNTICSG